MYRLHHRFQHAPPGEGRTKVEDGLDEAGRRLRLSYSQAGVLKSVQIFRDDLATLAEEIHYMPSGPVRQGQEPALRESKHTWYEETGARTEWTAPSRKKSSAEMLHYSPEGKIDWKQSYTPSGQASTREYYAYEPKGAKERRYTAQVDSYWAGQETVKESRLYRADGTLETLLRYNIDGRTLHNRTEYGEDGHTVTALKEFEKHRAFLTIYDANHQPRRMIETWDDKETPRAITYYEPADAPGAAPQVRSVSFFSGDRALESREEYKEGQLKKVVFYEQGTPVVVQDYEDHGTGKGKEYHLADGEMKEMVYDLKAMRDHKPIKPTATNEFYHTPSDDPAASPEEGTRYPKRKVTMSPDTRRIRTLEEYYPPEQGNQLQRRIQYHGDGKVVRERVEYDPAGELIGVERNHVNGQRAHEMLMLEEGKRVELRLYQPDGELLQALTYRALALSEQARATLASTERYFAPREPAAPLLQNSLEENQYLRRHDMNLARLKQYDNGQLVYERVLQSSTPERELSPLETWYHPTGNISSIRYYHDSGRLGGELHYTPQGERERACFYDEQGYRTHQLFYEPPDMPQLKLIYTKDIPTARTRYEPTEEAGIVRGTSEEVLTGQVRSIALYDLKDLGTPKEVLPLPPREARQPMQDWRQQLADRKERGGENTVT